MPEARSQDSKLGILVLGMHRSGTSALTRVLNLLGITIPHGLMEASTSNPTGFWESERIRGIHDAMLHSAGTSWDEWSHIESSWSESREAAGFRRDLRRAIEDECGDADTVLVKDPRVCRFVPLWIDLMESMGRSVRCVIPIRNPLEVAASHTARDGFVDDYSGVRISATGRRFFIEKATVWNVRDERGEFAGQAAMFRHWEYLTTR